MFSVMAILLFSHAISQCPSQKGYADKVSLLISNPSETNEGKLGKLEVLQQDYRHCFGANDSIYAAMLQHLAALQFMTSTNLNAVIGNMIESIRINSSGSIGSRKRNRADGYYHLGYYYSQLLFYKEAIECFDSAVSLAEEIPDLEIVMASELDKSYVLFLQGDYERCSEDVTSSLNLANRLHDTLRIISALYYRAQSYIKQRNIPAAAEDIRKHQSLLHKDDYVNQGNNYELWEQLSRSTGQYDKALAYRNRMVFLHKSNMNGDLLANDYLEMAILFEKGFNDNDKAAICLKEGLKWAQKVNNNNTVARILQDLGANDFFSRRYSESLDYYQKSLSTIFPFIGMNQPLRNPGFKECIYKTDIDVTVFLFENKAEVLQHLYKKTGDPRYLSACISTSRLTDSIITYMRNQQTGEQSKLYWRNQTGEFFANALEACWLAGDAKLAFYFMEKSRAVLLNDKLNELGAFAFLKGAEAAKQQSLQINIVEQERDLAGLDVGSPAYQDHQAKLLQAKDELERYIKTLEQKAPAYYQYKYADEVPALDSFQRFLAVGQQSFIHYFINDTVVYILAISPTNTRLLRLPYLGIQDKLSGFLQICSDKQALNGDYSTFAALSNTIYRSLFQPLQLPKGRVVVCPDNFLIPFEALCTDSSGKHFLLYDYTFDYVYSARYLLKAFNNPEGKGNFLGLAPASFATYLHVPDLQQSVASIQSAASYYSGHTCMTGKGATRRYFMGEAPDYAVVNVYSHARADNGDNEPLLFMSDSVIHLSELQLLRRPSAQLMVLSACQTNAGKNAAGEGIYSLARGFASAGIPAVASTLWQADERSTYDITEEFHRNLSQGMRKDEALQKAKLLFIRKGGIENMLPYYWANMILIGNANPVKLGTHHNYWWIALGMGCLLSLLFLAFYAGLIRSRTPPTTHTARTSGYDTTTASPLPH